MSKPTFGQVPQNDSKLIPLFGNPVLVNIQETFLPLIRQVLRTDSEEERSKEAHKRRVSHLDIRAILQGLGMETEIISWNQAIWIPRNFSDFLVSKVFPEESTSIVPSIRVNQAFILEEIESEAA